MTLIAMAVYDTIENNRSRYTAETLDSLLQTVDFGKHRLFIIDNGSCQETKDLLDYFQGKFDKQYPNVPEDQFGVIESETNQGTANAISLAWQYRKDYEHCIKMDNDVTVRHEGWVDEMEEAILRMPEIGIICLKRKELTQSTWNDNPLYKTELIELPHNRGQKWIVIEKVQSAFGTIQMYNSKLLDKIGYLYQMGGIYGFDDSLSDVRSELAGFINCFLVGWEITHLDEGGDAYTQEKSDYAAKMMPIFAQTVQEYRNGERPIYHNPFNK